MWTLHFIVGAVAGITLTIFLIKEERKISEGDIFNLFLCFGISTILGFVSAICIFAYLIFRSFVIKYKSIQIERSGKEVKR